MKLRQPSLRERCQIQQIIIWQMSECFLCAKAPSVYRWRFSYYSNIKTETWVHNHRIICTGRIGEMITMKKYIGGLLAIVMLAAFTVGYGLEKTGKTKVFSRINSVSSESLSADCH